MANDAERERERKGAPESKPLASRWGLQNKNCVCSKAGISFRAMESAATIPHAHGEHCADEAWADDDWDLSQKIMLLRKAYDALSNGGALIVYEAIIDNERRENAFGLLMSLRPYRERGPPRACSGRPPLAFAAP